MHRYVNGNTRYPRPPGARMIEGRGLLIDSIAQTSISCGLIDIYLPVYIDFVDVLRIAF